MNTEQELAIEVEISDLMTETVERMIAGLEALGKQKDALQERLDKIERLADCSSTEAFLALSDGDKARWFSTTGQRDRWARERIEQLEAQMEKARELAAQWRSQIDDTDDAFYARGVAAGYRHCADELEAALAQPEEADEPEALPPHCLSPAEQKIMHRALLNSTEEVNTPETLPLMALRDSLQEAHQISWCEDGNAYVLVRHGDGESIGEYAAPEWNDPRRANQCFRISDTDEHGLPVVVREPGMEPWAKYVHRSNGWISYYRDLPDRPDTEGFQRIEDYNEQEADHD